MVHPRLAFIGAGQLACHCIAGLIASGYPKSAICATRRTSSALSALQVRYGIDVTTHNAVAVREADCVFLCVKPHSVKSVMLALQRDMDAQTLMRPLWISVVAGLQIDTLRAHLLPTAVVQGAAPAGTVVSIVRAMPNLAVALGKGVVGAFAPLSLDTACREHATRIFQALGLTIWVESEVELNLITALAGSGPGYVFRLMEAFENAAVALGMEAGSASQLIRQTFDGAVSMAMQDQTPLRTLYQRVASKGGTTEAGLAVLDAAGIDALVDRVLRAASERAVALDTPRCFPDDAF